MARQTPPARLALYTLIPCLALAALVGSGYWIGERAATDRLREHVLANDRSESLGETLSRAERDRDEIAKAYEDSEAARRDMDSYPWVASHVLAPFVGHGPKPGDHAGAFVSNLLLRTRRPLELPKPAGHYRIFLVGGSTAWGAGAPDDRRTIGGYLQSILHAEGDRPFEVFTLAQPAWASTHERIAIENRILEWMPDLVISLSGANDVFWGREGRNVLWFRSFADEHYFQLIERVYAMLDNPPMPDPTVVSEEPVACETVATRLERNVSLSRHALGLVNADYLWILQPTLYMHRSTAAREEGYERSCYAEIDRRLKSLAGDNLHYRSLAELFDGEEQEKVFLDSTHFGDRGNEQIARAIAREVSRLASRAKATRR